MNLGQFQREVEYLDPGLPVDDELVEPSAEPVAVVAGDAALAGVAHQAEEYAHATE